MKTKFIAFFFLLCICGVVAQVPHAVRDSQGRHMVPRGFVNNTEDGNGTIYYSPNDYHRMVKLGANFQVIRLNLGKLGGYPGNELNESYLVHIDSLVQMGKNAGIMTDFKMTVYGINGFNWGDFWRNKEGHYDKLEAAWRQLWIRYKNESSVYAYDLLNEPKKGDFNVSYTELESDYLIPLIQKLIDECHKVNPEKKCFYQPILVNDPDRKDFNPPFIKMKTLVKGKNVFYAPHIYESNVGKIREWFNQYYKDAEVSGMPLFLGEWGEATYASTDKTLEKQANYQNFYNETVKIIDSLGIGSIKAWFMGTNFNVSQTDDPATWAIFKDKNPVGTVERKYIIDIIARPYPQCIAGDILSFNFDLPTRCFNLSLKADNSLGISRIFIPANRHYPDGFTVTIGESQFIFDPLKNIGLEVKKTAKDGIIPELFWDPYRLQLVVVKWPSEGEKLDLTIQPGNSTEIFFK